jgi:hypothetical protein
MRGTKEGRWEAEYGAAYVLCDHYLSDAERVQINPDNFRTYEPEEDNKQ